MDRAASHRQARSFSDIKIGDKAQFEVEINEESHASFAKLFGDFSPIHCDDKFCSKTKCAADHFPYRIKILLPFLKYQIHQFLESGWGR